MGHFSEVKSTKIISLIVHCNIWKELSMLVRTKTVSKYMQMHTYFKTAYTGCDVLSEKEVCNLAIMFIRCVRPVAWCLKIREQ